MRLVRLGQQPSRVAEDIRASLASLGRGITVIGGVALVGVRPSTLVPQIGNVDAIVVQPRGVLIVLGVDLPDPAMKLEAPLQGPWKADGWALAGSEKAVNPATPKLELAERITRHLRPKVPAALPIGTVLAVGPFVDEVDQPPTDVAGPVRVLHPTAKHMLAASVSLASAAAPCSVEEARALLKALAPEAPPLSDEILKAEGFGVTTDAVRTTEKMPHPEKTEKMPSPPKKPGRKSGAGNGGSGSDGAGAGAASGSASGGSAAGNTVTAPGPGGSPGGGSGLTTPGVTANAAATGLPSAVPVSPGLSVSQQPRTQQPFTAQRPQAPATPQPRPAPHPVQQTQAPQQKSRGQQPGTMPAQPAGPAAPHAPGAGITPPLPAEATMPVPRISAAAPARAAKVRKTKDPSDKPGVVKWLPYGAIGLLGVLLVLAIVLASTTGGDDDSAAPAAPSQVVNGISLVQRAAATDAQCAAHAVGDLQADLQRTGCLTLRRASFETVLNSKAAAVSVAVVTFADGATAAAFKRTADTPGGGAIPDLAQETGKWPRTPHFSGTAVYLSTVDGASVRLVLASWFDQPSTADDPSLVQAAQAGLTARVP